VSHFSPYSWEEVQVFTLDAEDSWCKKMVTVKILQSLVGQCEAFTLVVPDAKLYTKEMN